MGVGVGIIGVSVGVGMACSPRSLILDIPKMPRPTRRIATTIYKKIGGKIRFIGTGVP
jgi:hypothetical protein